MERKRKRDYDSSVTGFRVVRKATKEPEPEQTSLQVVEGKNPHAVALGRLGGLKGGKARSEKLTPAQRRDIAKKAADIRWRKNG